MESSLGQKLIDEEIKEPSESKGSLFALLAMTCLYLFTVTFFLHSLRTIKPELSEYINGKNHKETYEGFFSAVWIFSVIFGFPWGALSDYLTASTCMFLCSILTILGQGLFALFLYYGESIKENPIYSQAARGAIMSVAYIGLSIYGLSLMMTRVTINKTNSILHPKKYQATVISFNSAFGHIASASSNLIASYMTKKYGIKHFFICLSFFSISTLIISIVIKFLIKSQKKLKIHNKSELTEDNQINEPTSNFENRENSQSVTISEDPKKEQKQNSKLLKILFDKLKAVKDLNPTIFLILICGFLMEGVTQTFKNSLSEVCDVFLNFNIIQTGYALFLTKFLVILKPVSGYILERWFPRITSYIFHISGTLVFSVHFSIFLLFNKLTSDKSLETIPSVSYYRVVFSILLVARALYEILFFPFLYGTIGRIVETSRKGVAYGLTVSVMALGSFILPLVQNSIQGKYLKEMKTVDKDADKDLILKWVKRNGIVKMQIVFMVIGIVVFITAFFINKIMANRRKRGSSSLTTIENRT
eukprot:GAHX01002127.1.p1 GENE.GAHX01002127.1~~GAHX01002127.1.p1  ORF type:complete len:533 (+),score=63.36 GAHX01002127.1:17-1615(+)